MREDVGGGSDYIDGTSARRAGRAILAAGQRLSEDERQQLRMAAQKTVLRSQGDTEAMLEELRPYIAHAERSREMPSHAA